MNLLVADSPSLGQTPKRSGPVNLELTLIGVSSFSSGQIAYRAYFDELESVDILLPNNSLPRDPAAHELGLNLVSLRHKHRLGSVPG